MAPFKGSFDLGSGVSGFFPLGLPLLVHLSNAQIFALEVAGKIRSFEKGNDAILCSTAFLLAWSPVIEGTTSARDTR